MTEEEILARIMAQIKDLENLLGQKFSLPVEEPKLMNVKETIEGKASEHAGKTARTKFCTSKMKC